MNSQNKELRKIYNAFPEAFINDENEMIIYPEHNIYFLLDNVSSELELDCKVLEYCSREALKSEDVDSHVYHRSSMEDYFNRSFDKEELEAIYRCLGNGINRELCIRFIESGFDYNLLGLCRLV